MRVEHWDVAMQQGMHAARNMLGEDRDYDVVPYFFSDLADWASLEYVGPAYEWDEEIWRGDRDGGEFSVWYLKDGRVAGALSVEPLRRSRRGPSPARRRRRRLRRRDRDRRPRQRPGRDLLTRERPLRLRARRSDILQIFTLRPGVMAARLALDEVVGVRVPGPQFALVRTAGRALSGSAANIRSQWRGKIPIGRVPLSRNGS